MLETIRDIAIIVLAILDIVLIGLLCIIAFILYRLFVKVKGDVPELLNTAKATATTVKGTTEFISERAVTPIIRVAAMLTAISRFFAVLFGGERSRVS